MPGHRDGRRAGVPQLRRRVDQRHARPSSRTSRSPATRPSSGSPSDSATTTSRPPRRPSASGGAGATSSASRGVRRQRPEHHGRHGCRRRRDRQGRVEVSPSRWPSCRGASGGAPSCRPSSSRTPTRPARPTPLDGGAVAQHPLDDVLGRRVRHRHRAARGARAAGPRQDRVGGARSDPDVPPRVWFTGYQGDVAFAVLVEEGRSGGTVAARSPRTSSPTWAGPPPSPTSPAGPASASPRRVPPLPTGKSGRNSGPARHPDGAFAKTRGPGSDGADLVGLRALGALGDLELDPLGLLEAPVALDVDG